MTEKLVKGQPLDHPVHRAPPGEGARGPWASETGVVQQSIYDGAGNEVVVVTTTNADGVRKQGTGPTTAGALEQEVREPVVAEGDLDPLGRVFRTLLHTQQPFIERRQRAGAEAVEHQPGDDWARSGVDAERMAGRIGVDAPVAEVRQQRPA